MEYAVSRAGTTLVTLHEGTDTTACTAATKTVADSLADVAAAGTIADWAVDDASVYEHPAGPFDPYTVAVAFAVTVVVEGEDAAAVESVGASAIDDALEAAGVDAVSYTDDPTVSTA